MLYSALLSELKWVEHGFGTRADAVPQEKMASLKQIHSSKVLVAERFGCAGEGDALVTRHAGVPLSVRTADCYPILLADRRTRAVAAVHAGWRGTAGHIAVKAVTEMHAKFGTEPQDLQVAIGPGIGACCYQIGLEVARQFGLEQAGRIDLAELNRCQLVKAGLHATQIDVLGGCTKCDVHRFHSYRRDQLDAGRMVSCIERMGHPATAYADYV